MVLSELIVLNWRGVFLMDELFERRDVVLLRVSILPEDRIWLVVRMLGDKVPRSTVLAVKEPVNEV